ncbi:MAG: formiminotetrahydrofolate cyclodeaminase [Candidatus Azotimanducaceae bacterium]|jgi:formiminotetrahydrofolate cyclodeaminase
MSDKSPPSNKGANTTSSTTSSTTIADYLSALASRKSTPGGGAVAAMSGAQAAALISMVAELTKTFPDELTQPNVIKQATEAVQRFTELADQDAAAFAALMQAYKNKTDIQSGLQSAAAPPLACLELCAQLVEPLRVIHLHGNPNLITDTGIAALLLRDTIISSELNVLINLRSIEDELFKQTARATVETAKQHIALLDRMAADITHQLS